MASDAGDASSLNSQGMVNDASSTHIANKISPAPFANQVDGAQPVQRVRVTKFTHPSKGMLNLLRTRLPPRHDVTNAVAPDKRVELRLRFKAEQTP
jgi:hypothetical protein